MNQPVIKAVVCLAIEAHLTSYTVNVAQMSFIHRYHAVQNDLLAIDHVHVNICATTKSLTIVIHLLRLFIYLNLALIFIIIVMVVSCIFFFFFDIRSLCTKLSAVHGIYEKILSWST